MLNYIHSPQFQQTCHRISLGRYMHAHLWDDVVLFLGFQVSNLDRSIKVGTVNQLRPLDSELGMTYALRYRLKYLMACSSI